MSCAFTVSNPVNNVNIASNLVNIASNLVNIPSNIVNIASILVNIARNPMDIIASNSEYNNGCFSPNGD